MASMMQRVASRVFGLPTNDDVESLRSELRSLEVRVKMRPGASGVPMGYGSFEYEYAQSMKGSARWAEFDKMEADPHIKSGLDSVIMPLVTASWDVLPGGDSDKDDEIAEFVAACLLRKPSKRFGQEFFVQTPWSAQRLPEVLDMLRSGFAMFAKSTREVDGKIVYDRLQWLEPKTVDTMGWVLSQTDDILAVKRTFTDPTLMQRFQEPIPAKQLALYVWDLKGARFEGRSRLRSLYGSWLRKDFIARSAVIWAQKVGAPMPVAHYPSALKDQVVNVERAAQLARGQSPAEAYAMFPKANDGQKVEIEYIGVNTGEVDRMRGLIDGENAEIAHGLMTKSLLAGETTTGSRAVAQTQSDDEDIFVQAVAEIVCSIENDGIANLPGLVQELVDWNYPGVKAYPKLTVSRVGPWEDFTTLDPLIKAVQAGLVPKTPEVRKQITEKFGIRLSDDAYEIEPEPPVVPLPTGPVPPDQQAEPTDEEDDGEGEDARPTTEERVQAALAASGTLRERFAKLLAPAPNFRTPKGSRRAPNVLEAKTVSLANVKASMDNGTRDLHQDLRVIRDKMIEDIMSKIRTGKVTKRNLDGLRRSKFRGTTAAARRLQDTLRRIGEEGLTHVDEEITRGRSRP